MKIAVLGPRGTNGHEAALRVFGDIPDSDLIFCPRNVDIFGECIADSRVVGVTPFENSTTLLVSDVIGFWRTNIGAKPPINVIGEVRIPIKHCLLVHPDCSGLSSIRRVKSHPQALQQCSDLIASQGWQAVPALSTAAAAQEINDLGPSEFAAIASPFAARVYGLKVVSDGIHNCPTNETRFHVIGSESKAITGNDKTAIIFELKDVPGALDGVTTIFRMYGINMSSIISMATGKLGVYAFYVEINRHRDSPDGSAAIDLMSKYCEQMSVLGSYPVAG